MEPTPRLATPQCLVDAYPPDAALLLARFRGLVDEDMIREISEADYGSDAEEHLAALLKIWREGVLPDQLAWEPREVLELIRWSEPEEPGWKPGATGRRGHLMRGFACTVLLRAIRQPANRPYMEGANETLVQLLDSAQALDENLWPALARLLTWQLPQLGDEDDAPFFAFALLLVALLDPGLALTDAQWQEIANWVTAEEAAVRAAPFFLEPPHVQQWLYGLSYHDQRTTKWRAVGALARQRTNLPKLQALLDRAIRE